MWQRFDRVLLVAINLPARNAAESRNVTPGGPLPWGACALSQPNPLIVRPNPVLDNQGLGVAGFPSGNMSSIKSE
jgi:hypothetical protein